MLTALLNVTTCPIGLVGHVMNKKHLGHNKKTVTASTTNTQMALISQHIGDLKLCVLKEDGDCLKLI